MPQAMNKPKMQASARKIKPFDAIISMLDAPM
jgi:hypothetical protein